MLRLLCTSRGGIARPFLAHAVAQADDSYFERLSGPDEPLPAIGTIRIIGPGTGLGVAHIWRDGSDYRVQATEGGHIDFAPLDSIEDAILARLRERHCRVSIERIVSGPSIVDIYEALAALDGRPFSALDDQTIWTKAVTPRTPLSDADIAALRRAARTDHDPRMWLFLEFALDTSMRQSEVGRARYCDVQWEQRRLILWEAKAGRRYQPMSERLVATLKAERDNLPPDERDGWIFPAKSKSGHVRQFNQSFRRVAVAANLNAKTVTPHLLRHTAITRLAERGVGDATIQKISGHKTASMVRRYTHIGEQAVDDAMRLLEHANRPDYTEITQNADRGVAA